MYHDGQTYIWVPSALTLWQLTTETAAIVNAVHSQIGKPSVSVGDLNPYYFALNDLDMGGAPFTRDATPGMAVCGPIQNLTYLPLTYVTLLVMFGGDVEGLPVWFEIPSKAANVPAVLAALDPDNPTWETWGTFGESHKPVQLGTKWYRSTALGQSGDLLDASLFIAASQQGNLPLLTKSEYMALQPQNNP